MQPVTLEACNRAAESWGTVGSLIPKDCELKTSRRLAKTACAPCRAAVTQLGGPSPSARATTRQHHQHHHLTRNTRRRRAQNTGDSERMTE